MMKRLVLVIGVAALTGGIGGVARGATFYGTVGPSATITLKPVDTLTISN